MTRARILCLYLYLSVSLLLVANPRSSSFSIWLADSRDCVMHMQLHLASEYASPITAVKLDCRRLSTADRPNKTGIFSPITNARSLLFAFFSLIYIYLLSLSILRVFSSSLFHAFFSSRNRLNGVGIILIRNDSSIEPPGGN